jgi:hypothetical protein
MIMCERFVRIDIEIPLSLYANLDNIKNGSAASGRILDVIKKEKTKIERRQRMRLIDAEALKAELTGRIALPDWVLTAVLHIIDNAPTVTPDKVKKNSIYGEMKENNNG